MDKKINIIKKWNKLPITTKSITIAYVVSLLVPITLVAVQKLLLMILDLFQDRISNDTYTTIYNHMLQLQGPAFLEFNLLALSFIWLVFRFIIPTILAYFNGLMLFKGIIKINNKNLYLFLSSILIYFVSLFISFIFFLFLDSFEFIEKIFKLFRFFSI